MKFILRKNVTMPTVVCISTFMSRIYDWNHWFKNKYPFHFDYPNMYLWIFHTQLRMKQIWKPLCQTVSLQRAMRIDCLQGLCSVNSRPCLKSCYPHTERDQQWLCCGITSTRSSESVNAKIMCFLRRNLALASRLTKDVACNTLVHTQLESAAPICHLYHKPQIVQQRTAARWTCMRWRNTRSVGDMLDELEWRSLEDRLNILLT